MPLARVTPASGMPEGQAPSHPAVDTVPAALASTDASLNTDASLSPDASLSTDASLSPAAAQRTEGAQPTEVALSPASQSATALLDAFVALGLRDIVLSPGSRSQALALAAATLESAGSVRLHVRVDERSAGFTALGLAVETGLPALVITTSGSAVAHLHPAVLEAHHSRVPLIVASADRPAELLGIRSNQTTVQAGIFGGAVRLSEQSAAPVAGPGLADAATALARRAWFAALGEPEPGPVHLNLAYREPLSAAHGTVDVNDLTDADARVDAGNSDAATGEFVDAKLPTVATPEALQLARGPRTIVIAGHGAGEHAEELARAGHWPLLAEVSSGARFGPNLVVAYRELLQDAGFGGEVERAIVFGHPTLSREVPALVQRDDVEVIVVDPVGVEWFNPGHRATRARAATTDDGPASTQERRWVGRWVHASRAVLEVDAAESATASPYLRSGVANGGHVENFAAQRAYVKAEFAAIRAPLTRRSLVETVWASTWPHDRLVFGASRLIRSADRVVPGKRIRVHSNRGLAGIDGTVATALGIALAAPEGAGVTRVILGDLAMLHDVGSLLLGAGERMPRIQLIVGNDGGGTIFDGLEVAQTAPADAFDRVMTTPQAVDIAALAAAYGWQHTLVSTKGALSEALTAPLAGPTILEIPLPR